MTLIRFADQFGFIWRLGKIGVAYFGNERRLCIGWGYVKDRRGPDDKAQVRWVQITIWPPSITLAKWTPI